MDKRLTPKRPLGSLLATALQGTAHSYEPRGSATHHVVEGCRVTFEGLERCEEGIERAITLYATDNGLEPLNIAPVKGMYRFMHNRDFVWITVSPTINPTECRATVLQYPPVFSF